MSGVRSQLVNFTLEFYKTGLFNELTKMYLRSIGHDSRYSYARGEIMGLFFADIAQFLTSRLDLGQVYQHFAKFVYRILPIDHW